MCYDFNSFLIYCTFTLVSLLNASTVFAGTWKTNESQKLPQPLADLTPKCTNLIYFPCTKEMFGNLKTPELRNLKYIPKPTRKTANRSLLHLRPEASNDVAVTSKSIQILLGHKSTTDVNSIHGRIKTLKKARPNPPEFVPTQTTRKGFPSVQTTTTEKNTLLASNALKPTLPIRRGSTKRPTQWPAAIAIKNTRGPTNTAATRSSAISSTGTNSPTTTTRPTSSSTTIRNAARIVNTPTLNSFSRPISPPLRSTVPFNGVRTSPLPAAPLIFAFPNQIFATTTARIPNPKTPDPRNELGLDIDLRYRI